MFQLIFDHVLTAYGDNGESAYNLRRDYQFPRGLGVENVGFIDVNKIADDVVARIHAVTEFAVNVAQQLGVNPELRRANEIVKSAPASFAAELDRPPGY